MGDEESGLEGVLPRVPDAVQRRNDHRDVGDGVPELCHIHRHLCPEKRISARVADPAIFHQIPDPNPTLAF